MKIGDVLHKIGNLPYLAIHMDCTLEEASRKIADVGHLRTIYVIGYDGRLQGILSTPDPFWPELLPKPYPT